VKKAREDAEREYLSAAFRPRLREIIRAQQLQAMKRLMVHAGFQFEADRAVWVLAGTTDTEIPHAELGQVLDEEGP
jgi:hypothetical protein